MTTPREALDALASDGACLWTEILEGEQLRDLEARSVGGLTLARRPIGLESLNEWLAGTFLSELASTVIGPGAHPVRALLMGKGNNQNWAISFHQDTTLALRDYRDVPGFGPWVNKAHFYQAQAPASVMAGMLATRIHLDDCGPENGPLKVLRGSHRHGKLDDATIASKTAYEKVMTFSALRGEVVLMKPLVLHGSDRASDPAPRRVLHIEWAAAPLPAGLAWAWF